MNNKFQIDLTAPNMTPKVPLEPAGTSLVKQFFSTLLDTTTTDHVTFTQIIPSPHQLPDEIQTIQTRLRAKMDKALMAPKEIDDPVQALVELFTNMPPDRGTWRDILEEPYG